MSLVPNPSHACRTCAAPLATGASACANCGQRPAAEPVYPITQVRPTAPPYPGAAPYPSAQPYPGAQPYPNAQPYPGAPQYPGAAAPGPAPYPGAAPYPAHHPVGPVGGAPLVVVTPKSPGIAVLLTFLWLGAGHLYAGSIGVGIGLIIFDFVLAVLAATGIGLIIAFPIWLISFAVVAFLAAGAATASNRRNGIVVR